MRTFLVKIFVSLFLFGCSVANATITVALVTPKAGDYEQQGSELISGVSKAIEEINNDGGLLGKKIKLLTIDDQCNDSIAISTAQMLTILKDSKVNLVIGPYCANSFDKVTDIYANAKIFQIIPTAVNRSQAKTIKKGLVKMLGYTNQQAKDFFNFYNSEFAGEKVAVIYNSTDAESTDEANALIDEFKKHGKAIILKLYTYDMTKKDYNALAKMVEKDGNTLAFVLGFSKNVRKMAYALKDRNESFNVFVNKYTAAKEYFEYLGKMAEGTYFLELQNKNDDPEFAETLVKLRLSGFDAEGLSIYGYSSIKLWESLVKKSKSFEYNKLSANLNNHNIKTDFGEKIFHNGSPLQNESYAIYKLENNNFIKKY